MYAVSYFTWSDSFNRSYGSVETGRKAIAIERFKSLGPSESVMLIPVQSLSSEFIHRVS